MGQTPLLARRAVAITAQPQCAGDSDVSNHKAVDVSLYVLVWGEAANLRHVPEALCFLYHQMRTAGLGVEPLLIATQPMAIMYRMV